MLFACSRGIFSPRTHQTISFFLTASIALNVLHTNNDPSPQNRGPVLARVHSPKQIRKSEIELDNGVMIRCCPCSQVSIRGFRVMAAILDEIGFWRNEITAVNPAEDVLTRFSHCSVEIWQNTGEFATLRASESVCASQRRWKHLAVLFESANLLCHSISTHTSPR